MEVNPSHNFEPKFDVSNSENPFDWHITTPRLYISRLNPSNDTHCNFTVYLYHNPVSVRYNPYGPALIPNAEAARSFIAGNVDKVQRTGYGRYLVSLRTGDNVEHEKFSNRDIEHVGCVSMQLNRIANIPGPKIPDLGFNILPEYHGKGIANEAATCLMRWFRESKGVEAFAGMTNHENEAAKKALTRLGFKCWGPRDVKGVVNLGKETRLSVWTLGVDEEEMLEGLGL